MIFYFLKYFKSGQHNCHLVPAWHEAEPQSLAPSDLTPRCPTVSAGNSGPVPAPRPGSAQGLEHRGQRGEKVWCRRLPILLPAVSEWLCLPSPCVSATSSCPLFFSLPTFTLPALNAKALAHRFFLFGERGATVQEKQMLASPWRTGAIGPQCYSLPRSYLSSVPIPHPLSTHRLTGRLQAWQGLRYA